MNTKYGFLNGLEDNELYPNGTLKLCRVTEANILETKIGKLIPQYETRDERRKLTGTLEFYDNGDLMSICLDEKITVETPIGNIPAEKILFYKSEKIKRIFPLNGKLSGYWGEENEYSLAENISFRLEDKEIKSKFISVAFYESGALRSLTLWPREILNLETEFGNIKVRKGISFYENGKIKSYEPAVETKLDTPIGTISAFHNEIVGLNGDCNSIEFYSDGIIKAIYTCSNSIRVVEEENEHVIEPQLKAGWCNELIKIPVPVKINFLENSVLFNDNKSFNMNSKFYIKDISYKNIEEELTC
ncbi:MAG: hypothetical protein KA384_09465 [Leptotrichiaceae bacterium]|nr:hypothetical protein [Leptotrichiaceae bacterium]